MGKMGYPKTNIHVLITTIIKAKIKEIRELRSLLR